METSNKTLALLLIAAIIISLGGTIIGLNKMWLYNEQGISGLATLGTGRVNLTISQNLSCVVMSNVTFGSGGAPVAAFNLSTDGAAGNTNNGWLDCTNIGNNCYGITVNNTGNVNANVTFASEIQGATLTAGQLLSSNNDFVFRVKNGTDTGANPGCKVANNLNTWSVVNTTPMPACTNLTYQSANNIVTLEFNITLQPDIPAGAKGSYLSINCTAA